MRTARRGMYGRRGAKKRKEKYVNFISILMQYYVSNLNYMNHLLKLIREAERRAIEHFALHVGRLSLSSESSAQALRSFEE
jgi:hypothetical protein